MKYRLVELLQCPRCQADLEVAGAEHRVNAEKSGPIFRCRRYCALERCSIIPASETCAECGRSEIVSGMLACRKCRATYPVVSGIPWIFDKAPGDDARTAATVHVYSHLWTHHAPAAAPGPNHLDPMEETLGRTIVRGAVGLDAGSGCGADTVAMARRYPDVEIISLDLSDGVYQTYQRAERLPNVHVVRGSVLAIPIQSSACDFAYSFGVLHHTVDSQKGMQEIARILKKQGEVSLYLYEDHKDNPWKSVPLQAVRALRRLTTRLPTRVLSAFCYLLSPLIVLGFSVPARILGRFAATRAMAEQMPFNFGTSLFSVHGDLLDRLGAPIEERYSREDVAALLGKGGLETITITKLKATAGWVARGLKPAV